MDIIQKYFPHLSTQQVSLIAQLQPLYQNWNTKVNVISRKDMDNFYTNHVLHSLFIGKIFDFCSGTRILDVGTGGGFPGIPLAILFPECRFMLIDSIGKKINVVKQVIHDLKLENVESSQQRAEKIKGKYEFIVSRAVTNLPEFMNWVNQKIDTSTHRNKMKNGVLYLKGGDFSEELSKVNYDFDIFNVSEHFKEDYFSTKKLVHIYSC